MNGQVITLQPGSGEYAGGAAERPDWSPSAQPPDPTTGVMAHTPDPTAYHDAGGRTMVPRSTRLGASQGFATTPGVVNIDADPATGAGAVQIDVSKLTKEGMDAAMRNSGGDPQLAYRMAAGVPASQPSVTQTPVEPARVAPEGQTGYVVPKATVGGSQVLPATAALGDGSAALTTYGQVENPSVKKPEGHNVSQIPTTVPTTATPTPLPPPTVAPHPHEPVQPAQAPAYTPAAPDPTQTAILQTLGAMNEQLSRMNNPPVPVVPPPPPEPVAPDPERVALERERAELSEMRSQLLKDSNGQVKAKESATEEDDNEPGLAVPEDALLPFLTDPASKPTVQVAFDLGPGGTHFKRFHHVTSSNRWISLIFDTRYEGDQFTPPTTPPDGQPIGLEFPQHKNRRVQAIVPEGCHMRIGCMDIINFLIVEEQGQAEGNFSPPQEVPYV